MEIIGTVIIWIITICMKIGEIFRILLRYLQRAFLRLGKFGKEYITDVKSEVKAGITHTRDGINRVTGLIKRSLHRKSKKRQKKYRTLVVFSISIKTKIKYFLLGCLFASLFI